MSAGAPKSIDLSLLQLPLEDGSYVGGVEVLATLQRICALRPDAGFGYPTEWDRIDRLRLELEASNRSELNYRRREPLIPWITSRPLYAALIPARQQGGETAGEFDLIRALLLVAAIRREQFPKAEDLRPELDAIARDSRREVDAVVRREKIALVEQLLRRREHLQTTRTLVSYLKRADTSADAIDVRFDNEVRQIGLSDTVATNQRRALQQFLGIVLLRGRSYKAREKTDRAGHVVNPHRASRVRPEWPSPSEAQLSLEGVDTTRDAVSPHDVFAERCVIPGAFTDASTTPIAQKNIAFERGRLYLRDAALPGSRRALTATELRLSRTAIIDISRNEPDLDQLSACTVALLISETGATKREVYGAITGASTPSSSSFSVDLERNVWIRRPPPIANSWIPAPDHADGLEVTARHFHKPMQAIELPLSLAATEMIRNFRAHPMKIGRGSLSQALNELERSVRTKVPRFSVPKLRGTVPALIIERTGDITLAQVLMSDSLGFSPASLYYFCRSTANVFTSFEASLEQAIGPLHARNQRVGFFGHSSAALLCDEIAHEIVRNAKEQAVNAMKVSTTGMSRSQTLEVWLDRIDKLSRYTGLCIACATGSRPLGRSAAITINHLLPDLGLVLMSDKISELHTIVRVCATGEIAGAQANALLDLLFTFQGWLSKQNARHSHTEADCLAKVSAALNGRAPIYLIRNGSTLEHPEPRWIADVFHRGLPSNVFRHRMARRLHELGASALDVAGQMGHEHFGPRFTESSLDTALEFCARLNPIVDTYLAADGWTVLSFSGAKTSWMTGYKLQWSSGRQKRKFENEMLMLEQKKRQSEVKRFRKIKDSVFSSVASAFASHSVHISKIDNLPAGISLSNDQLLEIAHLVLTNAGSDPLDRRMAQAELDIIIRTGIRKNGWISELPPQRYERRESPSLIAEAQVSAYREVGLIRSFISGAHLSTPGHGPRKICPNGIAPCNDDPVGNFLAELIFNYGVSDIEVLLESFRGLPHMSMHDQLPGCVSIPLFREANETATQTREVTLVLGGAATISACRVLAEIGATNSQNKRPESAEQVFAALNRFLPEQARSTHLRWYLESSDLAHDIEAIRPRPFSIEARGSASLSEHGLACLLGHDDIRGADLPPEIMETFRTPERALQSSCADTIHISELRTILRMIRSQPHVSRRTILRNAFIAATGTTSSYSSDSVDAKRIYAMTASLLRDCSATVSVLVRYAQHLFSRQKRTPGSKADDRLRISSAMTYIFVISLVSRKLGGTSIFSLSSDGLEKLYRDIIEAKEPTRRKETAVHLINLHRFISRDYDFPVVDFSEIFEGIAHSSNPSENGFISQSAYTRIRQALDSPPDWLLKAGFSGEDCLTGKMVATLMYRFGPRFGDAFYLRFSDVYIYPDHIGIHPRPTQYHLQKSYKANRYLETERLVAEQEFREVEAWITRERERRGIRWAASQPLFFSSEEPSPAKHEYRIQRLLSLLIKSVTGDRTARPHWLRHAHVMALLSPRTRRGSSLPSLQATILDPTLPVTVYGLQVARHIGHSRLCTTLSAYEHLRSISFCEERNLDLFRLTSLELENLTGSKNRSRKRLWDFKASGRSASEFSDYLLRSSGFEISRYASAVVEKTPTASFGPSRGPTMSAIYRHVRPLDVLSVLQDLHAGETKTALLNRHNLSEEQLVSITVQLAAAQQQAHDCLISRDTTAAILGVDKDCFILSSRLANLQFGRARVILSSYRPIDANLPIQAAVPLVRKLYVSPIGITPITPEQNAAIDSVRKSFDVEKDARIAARHLWIALVALEISQSEPIAACRSAAAILGLQDRIAKHSISGEPQEPASPSNSSEIVEIAHGKNYSVSKKRSQRTRERQFMLF